MSKAPNTDWSSADDCVALFASEDECRAIERLLQGRDVQLIRLDLASICRAIVAGELTTALVAQDALTDAGLDQLREAAMTQPGWSDFPILMIAERGDFEARPALLECGQVRVVERPLHAGIVASAVQSARRSRRFQRQGQAFSSEILEAEEHYKSLSHSLERNLARQIADLEALRDQLTTEVEERRHAEEALRESEDLYRFTVELGEHIIWVMDGDEIRTIGSHFSEITGTDPARPPGEVLPEVIHPDDLPQLAEKWVSFGTSGDQYSAEYRIRVADGTYRIFYSRGGPRYDEQGNIVRWYGFSQDVTEQREATEALRQAEERYRLAARATNDAIWDWNLETDQIDWSDAAATYLGSGVTESDIQWWESAIHVEDRDRVVRSVYAAIRGDRPRWSAAYRLRKADGDYAYVYDRGFIIRDADGKAVRAVGAVVDLTERRRAESELRRTQAELIHFSRVSAMGTMASTLAHELNQPLTAVASYVRGCRRLLSGLREPGIQQVCEALELAEAGAMRAGQIVRRLRELVARGTVSVESEDLAKLVEDACVLAFVDQHLHGITHHIEVAPDARWVEADRIQIQQVLINLIRNAVQALQSSERRHVTIACKPHGEDMIVVSVADTGGGIDDAVREALFSPFHSTKSEGMGIGLSISRTIVEAHHGKIWVEDGPGGGADFRFTLPRADGPSDDAFDAPEGARDASNLV